jgi:hypothetical protein
MFPFSSQTTMTVGPLSRMAADSLAKLSPSVLKMSTSGIFSGFLHVNFLQTSYELLANFY